MSRIMFWGTKEGTRPVDFVDVPVDANRRDAVLKFLQGGREINHAKGSAYCRICSVQLGSCDRQSKDGRFSWPDKAGHYIVAHNIWTPGCDELYRAEMRNLQERF